MKVKENLWVICIIACVAIFTRIIPHYPNFTALGGAAIFGGAYFRKRYAVLIPIIALFVSDLLLNNLIYAQQFPQNYNGFVFFEPAAIWTYAVFIMIALMSSRTIRSLKVLPIVGTAMAGSVLFFAVSNFAVWLGSPLYPKTIGGLMMSYAAGVPFFWNTIAGDMFFVSVFFGGFEVARRFVPGLSRRVA